MKPTLSYTGALASSLASVLLLSPNPVVAQTLTNPGFESNNFSTFPGYISGAANGPITGWTGSPADRVGQNPATSSPFANNGAIPGGVNVGFLQSGGTTTSTLKTTVTGLTIGTKYTVTVRVNARSNTPINLPYLRMSSDGTGDPVIAEVSRVATAVDATPYRTAAFEFTATGTSHELTFENARTSGDHTLLLDNVSVVPSSNAWSHSAWTGDADSGIDSSFIYTHAFKLGNTTNTTVNGVQFFGRQGTLPGLFTWNGLNSTAQFGAGVVQITGDSAALATPFRYGALPSLTLENLKPNTQYVFTVYGVAWDSATGSTPHRTVTFNSSLGGTPYSVNLNQYGQNKGLKVKYTYTTDATGTPVTVSFPALSQSLDFHVSAFCNREATARPPAVNWTIHEWNNDADSGASPNHVYTHAQSYASTVSQNINGVNFVGIGGQNPSGTNCAVTGMPGVYTNDANTITGYSATIAKDFIHGGAPSTFSLSGLTPGKQYVFSLYTVGWETGVRQGAMYGAPGENAQILNQDQYGDNRGARFDCVYTADASGTAKIKDFGIDYATDGNKTIHVYASSNREVDAMVGVAPSFTLQPLGTTISEGGSFILRGAANGSSTLTYQWKRNNVDIPGADQPELELVDIQLADAGSYTLVSTNSVSSTTSNPAVITVLQRAPGLFNTGVDNLGVALAQGTVDTHYTLLANPDNIGSTMAFVQNPIPTPPWVPHTGTSTWIGPRAFTGGAAGLNADAGEGPGTYVYRTTVDLTGYDISTVQITGRWASDNNGVAIRVNTVATGLTHTGNTFGELLPFTINTTNAPGLIAGVNTIDFVVNNADAQQGYTGLHVVDFRAAGIIPAGTPPHITLQPQGGPGVHNGNITLVAGATGSAPLTYQWYRGTTPIPGADQPTLDVIISDISDGADYKVRVTNSVSSVDSNVATVAVTNAIPVVVDDSLSTTVGTQLEIDINAQMLANDTDADNDTLELETFGATSFNGGTVTRDGGYLYYTPAPGFTGLDGFTYTVNDGWGGISSVGSVLINVTAAASGAPGQMTLAVDLTGGSVTGTFTGTPGATYILQRSTTLLADSWITVDTEVAPASGVVTVLDEDPPAVRAFYRISYTE
ncbi:Ig-like domain-containing protein [Luteolibacter flavescens]|uniref:Ig-like domain-containing protein n=1 Tax=Luteolibacter flavescens TaxID=1859460 RepID=A0ABT3FNG8_9BACT|nr:Ig-like domain-containing protein [Luteolibacter flavescens]MCW1885116.1 Ig-like domain-containing protein [Luteolibacter flavescens]